MNKDKIIKKELTKKRDELITNLHIYQEYNFTDIAFIFRLAHTTVLRIVKKNDKTL